MGKRLAVLTLFCAALVLFVLQTAQAFGVVTFHADLLEKRGVIVLDAGHGGEDGGAVGANGALEKEINLAITLHLRDLLKENNFEVILTRDGDYAVGDSSLATVAERKRSDTKTRLRILEETGECVFLSIHQNFFEQSKYDGAQVFYSPNREESALLAECVRQSIVESLQPDNTRQNKIGDSGIYLLAHAQVPAVLVECGFLSNPAEADRLCDPAYQRDMAAAVYNGLIDYLEALRTQEQTK